MFRLAYTVPQNPRPKRVSHRELLRLSPPRLHQSSPPMFLRYALESIPNSELYKQTVKKDLADGSIDFFEVKGEADAEEYKSIVFASLSRRYPIITCSDNHDIRDYKFSCPCWVKADPTFDGLRQLTIETDSRIHLRTSPHLVDDLKRTPSRFLSTITFKRLESAPANELWFDVTLALNPAMVAVIGNKGSGKSALTDTIGLLGNSFAEEHFSFLNADSFRNVRNNKATFFEATLHFVSGESTSQSLDSRVDKGNPESVLYLPQRRIESLCNELSNAAGSSFDRELKRVIFDYVDETERAGCTTLDELLKKKEESLFAGIEQTRSQISVLNRSIIDLEDKMLPSNRKQIESEIVRIEAEIDGHNKLKPTILPLPTDDVDTSGSSSLETFRKALEDVEKSIKETTDKISQLNKNKVALASIRRYIENFQVVHTQLLEDIAPLCSMLGFGIAEIVSMTVDVSKIVELESNNDIQVEELRKDLSESNVSGLVVKQRELRESISRQIEALQLPQKIHHESVEAHNAWERKQLELATRLGEKKTEANALNELPSQLKEACQRREELTTLIHRSLLVHIDAMKDLYSGVMHHIDELSQSRETIKFSFAATLEARTFASQFVGFLNLGRRGSFYGSADGVKVLDKLLGTHDLTDEQSGAALANQVLDYLRSDKRQEPALQVDIESQLRGGVDKKQIYDFLFSLKYFEPNYSLLWNGVRVSQLSAGERGSLLLVFYLMLDKRNCPLIIDQPEDNLDNETVFELLVPAIRAAKLRRQIIIVTHNPNLAVVCDAEQIVRAQIDKANGNRITYVSGAIENRAMKAHVVNVLEGTQPAFRYREKSYSDY
jgi:ABC-type lipoprotein export system ATPase subunit